MNPIQKTFQSIHATQESKNRVFAQVMQPQKKHSLWKPILTLACACFLVFTMTQMQVRAQVVAYVSVDVNPSLEFGLNKYDQVVNVIAYNEDSQALCDSLSLKNKSIEQALSLLLEEDSMLVALQENPLYITVTSDQETQLLETIENIPAVQTHQATCQGASSETHEEAHEHGMTVSRYSAYLVLQESGVEITEEEINSLTMNEIHQMCQEHELDGPLDSSQGHGAGSQGNGNSGEEEGPQNNGNSNGGHHGENYHH